MKLKKILKVLLFVLVAGACIHFVSIYKVATKDIGGFEEKTLQFNQQNKTFFVEHLGEEIEVKAVKNILGLNVDKKPDMKVYYFEHNLVDSYLFSSGVEIFSGEYTPEELRACILKNMKSELFVNCFLICLFVCCFYIFC